MYIFTPLIYLSISTILHGQYNFGVMCANCLYLLSSMCIVCIYNYVCLSILLQVVTAIMAFASLISLAAGGLASLFFFLLNSSVEEEDLAGHIMPREAEELIDAGTSLRPLAAHKDRTRAGALLSYPC